jgi:tRNA(Ile)-lysidine synthase TilS/MesJ
MGKQDTPLSERLGYYLLRAVNKAIRDYEMIAVGDRVAVAVSGGKDSLTLLHLLNLRMRSMPERYELVAIHVRMSRSNGSLCEGPDVQDTLERHLQVQGQAYRIECADVEGEPTCFRCIHVRRGAIFSAAQRLGCHKVAFGHHADDAAQTTLLNLFFHGKVEMLSPTRAMWDGALHIIRPPIYLPETRVARFAEAAVLPIVHATCPQSVTSRRTLVRDIIRDLEQEYPKVKINLFRAGLDNTDAPQRTAGIGSIS